MSNLEIIQVSVREYDFVFITYVCVGLCVFGPKARVMQSLGQALEIEVFDKDEGNNDDKLGRWVRGDAGAGAGAVGGGGHRRGGTGGGRLLTIV